MNSYQLSKKFDNWLFFDFPPLDGRIRIFFYSVLIFLGGWNIASNQNFVAACPPYFYEPIGFLRDFSFFNDLTPIQLSHLMATLSTPLKICWILSVVGFLGRLPMMATGLLFMFFWGATKGCMGTSHTWHLPMYCMLILGFFSSPDHKWSLDGYISRYAKNYWFNPDNYKLASTGIARKLILLFCIFALFSAGLGKLWEAGLPWLDGISLQNYLHKIGRPVGYIGNTLMQMIIEHSWVSALLSVAAVFLEIGCLFILFAPRYRNFFVVYAVAFHIFIYLTMIPQYFAHIACYSLIVNWSLFKQKNSFGATSAPPAPLKPKTLLTGRISSIVIMIILICTIIIRAEWFPLGLYPMYSSYLTKDRITNVRIDRLDDPKYLRDVSTTFLNTQRPWFLKFYFPRSLKCNVYLANGEIIEYSLREHHPRISPTMLDRLTRYSMETFIYDTDSSKTRLRHILLKKLKPQIDRYLRGNKIKERITKIDLLLPDGSLLITGDIMTR